MKNYTIKYVDDDSIKSGGVCKYPWFPKYGTCKILIKKKYLYDKGLLEHEKNHAKQYERVFFHGIRYTFSKEYRYKCELEAYQMQIEVYEYTKLNQVQWIINALMTKYNLGYEYLKVESDVKKILSKGNSYDGEG